MVNLKEKYQNEIAAIKADAQANLDEATAIEKERADVMQNASDEVAQLQQKAKSSHRSFFKMAFRILKLAFSKKPTVVDVTLVTAPCGSYTDAISKLPKAENELYDAKCMLEQAESVLIDAQEEFDIIANL